MSLKIPKRTQGEIQRFFKTSCLNCEFSRVVPNKDPSESYCQKFRTEVDHFNEGCAKHQPTKRLKDLQKKHWLYLIESPIIK